MEEPKTQRKRAAKSNGKSQNSEGTPKVDVAKAEDAIDEGMLTSNSAYMLFYTKKGRKPIDSGDLTHLQPLQEQVKDENLDLENEVKQWQEQQKVATIH